MDADGTIYPALYVRRAGRLTEHQLEPHPTYAFDSERTAAAPRRSCGRCSAPTRPGLASEGHSASAPNFRRQSETTRVERRIDGGPDARLTLRCGDAVLIVAVASVLSVSAAILVRLVDPAIGTFGDALWWAVSTVTHRRLRGRRPDEPGRPHRRRRS